MIGHAVVGSTFPSVVRCPLEHIAVSALGASGHIGKVLCRRVRYFANTDRTHIRTHYGAVGDFSACDAAVFDLNRVGCDLDGGVVYVHRDIAICGEITTARQTRTRVGIDSASCGHSSGPACRDVFTVPTRFIADFLNAHGSSNIEQRSRRICANTHKTTAIHKQAFIVSIARNPMICRHKVLQHRMVAEMIRGSARASTSTTRN